EMAGNISTESYAIKSLELDREIAQLQLKRIDRERLPTLSLNGYLGEQYYSNEFRLDRGEESVGNSFVNLALRIPISAYFKGKSSIQQTRLNTQLFDLQIVEEQELENISNSQQIVKIIAAKQNLQSLEHIDKLAKEHVQAQRQAYEEGRLLLNDYNRSILLYHQASRDVWQAQYDLTALLME